MLLSYFKTSILTAIFVPVIACSAIASLPSTSSLHNDGLQLKSTSSEDEKTWSIPWSKCDDNAGASSQPTEDSKLRLRAIEVQGEDYGVSTVLYTSEAWICVLFKDQFGQVINLERIQNSINKLQELADIVPEKEPGIPAWVQLQEFTLKEVRNDGTVVLQLLGRVIEDIRIVHLGSDGGAIDEKNGFAYQQTPNAAIIQALGLHPEERYSYTHKEVDAAVERIVNIGSFWDVAIYLKKGEDQNKLILFLYLSEKNKAEIAFDRVAKLSSEGTANSLAQAITKYQEALVLLREIGEPGDRIFGDTVEQFVEQSKAVFQLSQHRYPRPTTIDGLTRIAAIYKSLGEFRQSLNYYSQALSIAQSENKQEEATTISLMIADLYTALGNLEQAKNYYQQGLTLKLAALEKIQKKKRQVTYPNLTGDRAWEEMIEDVMKHTVKCDGQGSNPRSDASMFRFYAARHRMNRDSAKALRCLNQALQLSQSIGDIAAEAATLTYIARVNYEIGNVQQALNYYKQALTRWNSAGYQRSTSDLVWNYPSSNFELLVEIAQLYEILEQLPEALSYLEQALLAGANVPPDQSEASLLLAIGQVHSKLNQPDLALDYFQQAIPIFHARGDNNSEAAALGITGYVYLNYLNNPEKALEYASRYRTMAHAANNPSQEAVSVVLMAWVSNQLNKPQEALGYVNQAIPLFDLAENPFGKIEALILRGFFYENQGNSEQAITSYMEVINKIEFLQSKIKISELTASFATKKINVYENLFNLLWKSERYQEAFEVAERAKARAFLDQLANARIDTLSGASTQLLKRQQDLRYDINTLRNQLTTLKKHPQNEWKTEEIAEVGGKLLARERDYEALLIQIESQSPATASLVSADVAKLSEIQSQLASNTTLVEYFISQNRIFAFIITRDRFHPVTIDLSRKDLLEALRVWADESADPDLLAGSADPHPRSLKQLHEKLITPLQPYLQTSHLIIVPHNLLHYLPFAALTDGNSYLVDRYTLSLLPSANTLRLLSRPHTTTSKTILALGNPTAEALSPLQESEIEVKQIARLFGTQPRIREAATESVVRDLARNANILHLAAHGQYNSINPLFSTLYLAKDDRQDGRLEVHEIYGLDLSVTNLVVLSACQTSLGELSQGDEVVGLTRAFLYAGTPSVVSSLWNVDDVATAMLMEQFYTHFKSGMSAAESLQKAQQAVRKKHPHPYFWAAFSVTGSQ